MTDPWLPLLNNLPMSRTEREVVKRFESEPNGRAFLPVADILRAHKLTRESLELLTQGVERHPTFSVARVVLARELLQNGMVAEAWRILEESPVPLRDNLLAQKLRLKLALLLSDEAAVQSTAQHMKLNQMLDAETRKLADLIGTLGLEKAREHLVKEFSERGTTLVFPVTETAEAAADAPAESGAESVYFRTGALDDEVPLAGFHVVPLSEIFRPGDGSNSPATGRLGGVELDSTTLADIYARQGHYSKALAVYRRLLRMTPQNDLLRRKVQELAKLDREQRDADLTVDPALVDRMESVEIIDRQIKFFNDLLTKMS